MINKFKYFKSYIPIYFDRTKRIIFIFKKIKKTKIANKDLYIKRVSKKLEDIKAIK